MWSVLTLLSVSSSLSWADEPASAGPRYPEAQLAFHGGLLQPLFLRGFNGAVDVRINRLVLSYSHGEGLDLTNVAGSLPEAQRDAGVSVDVPWTTGFGIGATLIDELYVMADFKAHRYEVDTRLETAAYTTFTVGAEVGYRLFVWEGLYLCPVIRYWPNVGSTAPEGFALTSSAGTFQHDPLRQGFNGLFANLLVGWSFDVRGERRSRTLIPSKSSRRRR